MPSVFASLAAAASATTDAVFAEGFELHTRSAPEIEAPILASGRPDVNARPVTSSGPSIFPFRGVFVAEGSRIHAHGRGMADSSTRAMVTDRPLIDIDVRALSVRPKANDVILRVDTGERFSVADPWEAVDHGRARIWLKTL